MSKLIGLIFEDEGIAVQAGLALKKLEASRGIALSGFALIEKIETGSIAVKHVSDKGSIGALGGAFIGGLAGLAGGPAAAVITAVGGAIVGHAADQLKTGDREKFSEKVSSVMRPGNTAFLADVTEYPGSSLDSLVSKLGGIVVRE